jgi:hypothetical protein
MASELPPTYYFTDITFNPAFYSSGSENITNEEAKKNYLTYPTAQGTETISTLNSSTITSNSYNLSGIPPTLTKSSLGYYVNYAIVSASYAASNKYYICTNIKHSSYRIPLLTDRCLYGEYSHDCSCSSGTNILKHLSDWGI